MIRVHAMSKAENTQPHVAKSICGVVVERVPQTANEWRMAKSKKPVRIVVDQRHLANRNYGSGCLNCMRVNATKEGPDRRSSKRRRVLLRQEFVIADVVADDHAADLLDGEIYKVLDIPLGSMTKPDAKSLIGHKCVVEVLA